MVKERNIAIDVLKFIAAILITNSHMGILYGKYNELATGGAIGDVLFFFCSGFTLFLSRGLRFDNWYKRRINRIYPTIFAWAILSAFVFDMNMGMDYIIIHGGGWFVTCIMIYYIILYFIQRFLIGKLWMVFGIVSLICVIWYILLDKPDDYNIYGETYFKWGHYFLFMLLGAIMGLGSGRNNWCVIKNTIFLFISIVVYYLILLVGRLYPAYNDLQIISILSLLSITYFCYNTCSCNKVINIYKSNIGGWIIKFIGGLCLEIYIVQGVFLSDKFNCIFPFNILFVFIIIVFAAYILRCCSRIFAQTFKDAEYNWKEIFKMV